MENFTVTLDIDQVKSLCLYMRNCPAEKPKAVMDFTNDLEDYLFATMTIEDAERFFNEE